MTSLDLSYPKITLYPTTWDLALLQTDQIHRYRLIYTSLQLHNPLCFPALSQIRNIASVATQNRPPYQPTMPIHLPWRQRVDAHLTIVTTEVRYVVA